MSDTTQHKSAEDTQVFKLSESGDDAQPKERRERDFARGKASHFIIVGVVITALFVLTVAAVVSLVLSFLT